MFAFILLHLAHGDLTVDMLGGKNHIHDMAFFCRRALLSYRAFAQKGCNTQKWLGAALVPDFVVHVWPVHVPLPTTNGEIPHCDICVQDT